jgi:hypothetical protein
MIERSIFKLYNKYILLKPFSAENITQKYLNSLNNKKINQFLIAGNLQFFGGMSNV